jgi:hypothetical protein
LLSYLVSWSTHPCINKKGRSSKRTSFKQKNF